MIPIVSIAKNHLTYFLHHRCFAYAAQTIHKRNLCRLIEHGPHFFDNIVATNND